MSRSTTRFAVVPEWVLFEASPNAVKLYCLLDRRAGRKGSCWPNRRVMAERMGVSLNTVDRAKQELVELGALVIEPRFRDDGGRSSNTYFLRRDQSGPLPTSEDTPLPTYEEGPLPTGATPKKNESKKELRPKDQDLTSLVHVPESDPLTLVYEHWRRVCGKTRPNYDRISPRRRQKIAARLREFTPADLCAALDGVAADPWPERPLHNDLTVVFRSQEQVERFLDLRHTPRPVTNGRVTAAELVRRAHETRRGELDALGS